MEIAWDLCFNSNLVNPKISIFMCATVHVMINRNEHLF